MSPNGVSNGNDSAYIPLPTDAPEGTKVYPSQDADKAALQELEKEKQSDSTDSQSDDAELVVPPDGGWGWVVVAGSFACNTVVDGITFASGMFLEDIASSMNVSAADVSIVGSLLAGFYLMVGPFASALANRYGFRLVAILGTIIASVGFALSYFATNLIFLCITCGIIGGIGFGLIYVPAVITVGFYFEKWRALATGIGVCGSGIGTFLFAPLCNMLVKQMGWRYSFLVQAALILTCAIFGASFRPLKPTKIKDLKKKESEAPQLVMDSSKLPTATKLKMEEALASMKAHSMHCLCEHQSTVPRMLGVSNNADYPTAAEICSARKVYHTISVPHNRRITQLHSKEKTLSVPSLHVIEDVSNGTENGDSVLDDHEFAPMIESKRRHTVSERRTQPEFEGSRSRPKVEVNRPLYRDDIFFGASLTRLPQYTSQTSIAYNLSVMRPPTKNDIEEEIVRECRLCPESVRRPLATMLDVSLLKSPSFIVLAISGALTMMGFYVPFIFLKERAILNGISADKAVWLISTIGITNTIGRVISGLFSSHPSVSVLLVNNVAISIAGIATMFSGVSFSEEYQFFYAVVFGLFISCFATLRSVLVVELLGLERLTNAFGLLLLFQGIAACAGTPIAGEFFNATGSYDQSFYLSGSLILASAVVCYPLNIINRWEKRKLADAKTVPV